MKYTGTVVTGKAYGRQLGFPTANIVCDTDIALKSGVYAGWVVIADERPVYRSGIVVFATGASVRIEAHLIDFTGDLYGQTISVYPDVYLRDFETYATEDLLIAAIAADIETIKETELCSPESLK